jgi:pilus assembly protein Flp/PilA
MQSTDRADETGATAVEYALLVAGIAAIIIAAVALLGTGVLGWFQDVCGGNSPFSC